MKGERRVDFAAVELAQRSLLTTKGKRFSTVDLAIPSRSERKSVMFPPPPTDLAIPLLSFLAIIGLHWLQETEAMSVLET
ncbi:unnamed protein product [Linum trigynum]|uniref:Uncharacterized protein n=1 Tax=Linum trigynum TaxID=586398 RepID=A0AAV2D246_9ROSI